jgi:ADP-heptose:LPS heptosyltransferase
VLRTKFLRLLFRLGGVRVATIDKGRAEKRRLVRREHKVMKPLKTSFQRYTDVMGRLGFPVTLNFTSIYGSGKGDLMEITSFVGEKGDCKWIGIAPFAKHEGKIYPIELQEQVVAHFAVRPDLRIFLFGGGEKEQETFDGWSNKYPSVISLGRTLTMGQELALISHLDVMLSMDSANMHLASLTGVPVVSIWGATHPYAGFMGWNQSADNAIQSDLPCRPCSVFGNKPCWQEKTYACLHSITPSQVIGKIEALIKEE